MTSARFKVGDRVRLTGRAWVDLGEAYNLPTGEQTITRIDADGDAYFEDHDGEEWYVAAKSYSAHEEDWAGALIESPATEKRATLKKLVDAAIAGRGRPVNEALDQLVDTLENTDALDTLRDVLEEAA